MRESLDLSKPDEARIYISVITIRESKPEYVDLTSGRRVWLNNMSDTDAVMIAHLFHEMIIEKEMN